MAKHKKSKPQESRVEETTVVDPHDVLRHPAQPPWPNLPALLVALTLFFLWFVYLVYVAVLG